MNSRMQELPGIVREYVGNLNDEELKALHMRLEQRFAGDEAEALLLISRHDGMDSWLKSANNHSEFWAMLDLLGQQLEYEHKRRMTK